MLVVLMSYWSMYLYWFDCEAWVVYSPQMEPSMARSPPTLPAVAITAAGKTSLGVPCSREGLFGSWLISRVFLQAVPVRSTAEIKPKRILFFIIMFTIF